MGKDSPDVIKTVLIQAQSLFPEKKRIAILQPHRFSRLKNLFQDYADTMSNLADEIILLPVFSAGEEELLNYNSYTLSQQIILQGFDAKKISVLSMSEAVESIKRRTEDNLLAITLGPGDVWKVAENLGKT